MGGGATGMAHGRDDSMNTNPNQFQGLFDVLTFCAPPLALLEHLERYEQRAPLPAEVTQWLGKWRTIRSDEPMPELDNMSE